MLLNVARQEYQKDQATLLRAFATVGLERPSALLLIAGREGGATVALRALATDLGIDDGVRWLGHRQDVPELLCAADVFVFPSLYEGLGGIIIEAMALEVPVVATDVPAIAEVVGPSLAARLTPPGDAAALAAAVLEVVGSAVLAEQLAGEGRRRFLEEFTVERMRTETVAAFRRVAGS